MPRYTTEIPAYGPDGNVFVIIANCARLMRQLGHSQAEIDDVRKRAMATTSYADACAVIEEWFPLDRGDD